MSLELPHSFDPSQLALLEKAFKAAWAVLKPKKMAAGSSQEQGQNLALANCLVAIAENGVNDPNELAKKAIERMLIGPAIRRQITERSFRKGFLCPIDWNSRLTKHWTD